MKCVSSIFSLFLLLAACSKREKLPMFDFTVVQRTNPDGKPQTDSAGSVLLDTIYFRVPPFQLLDQDSVTVSSKNFENKISVVDFFFTSCPTICPKMKQQLLRVHTHFTNNAEVELYSFTIDPRRDTVGKLKSFHSKLALQNDRWHFLTGQKDSLLNVSRAFMAPVREDPRLPGGFDHSGKFILVDRKGYFRGFYNGTTDTGTTRLIEDIEWLLHNE